MKKNKTNVSQARGKYEPIKIKVMKVTPQGVLCQSGGDGINGGISDMDRVTKSW